MRPLSPALLKTSARPCDSPRQRAAYLRSGKSDMFLVAHGKGSDPNHSGWVQHFSNVHGSEATSAGSYLVGDTYIGQYGESRRLIGLDPQNDQGKIGRSQGCFAFAKDDIREILDRVAPGCLLYADKV
jgi:hypothetical protein